MSIKSRLLYHSLLKEKATKKVSIIIGARQVGKTTILKMLHKKLGGLFLDLDLFSNFEQIATYENFINTLISNGYRRNQEEYFYLFLDEFQRYDDISKILKNVYDHHDNIKIYATGSSSLAIKTTLQESLAGRKHISYLYPLNFTEFLRFKNKNALNQKLKAIRNTSSENYEKLIPEILPLLDEFLIFGGYPAVVLSQVKNEKQQILNDIFDLYLKKDIVEYLRLEKIRNAKSLLEQLAVNHGTQAHYSQYGMQAGIDTKTVQNYIEIFKETFLIHVQKPYFTNKNKEITKMPKIYFVDNGVRNLFINNFNAMDKRTDAGVLFESFYISELLKRGIAPDQIKYYRTKNGQEVDIIVDRVSTQIPIEIKYKNKIKSRDSSPIKKFIREHALSTGYIINLGEMDTTDPIHKKAWFTFDFLSK